MSARLAAIADMRAFLVRFGTKAPLSQRPAADAELLLAKTEEFAEQFLDACDADSADVDAGAWAEIVAEIESLTRHVELRAQSQSEGSLQ